LFRGEAEACCPTVIVETGVSLHHSAINVLVTIFSEKESNAVDLLKQQNITRIGVVDYLKSLG
jgi:hypothetical protein